MPARNLGSNVCPWPRALPPAGRAGDISSSPHPTLAAMKEGAQDATPCGCGARPAGRGSYTRRAESPPIRAACVVALVTDHGPRTRTVSTAGLSDLGICIILQHHRASCFCCCSRPEPASSSRRRSAPAAKGARSTLFAIAIDHMHMHAS